MCGIVGFMNGRESGSEANLVAVVRGMASRLAHRGPDDHLIWTDTVAGVALGHRRLSVVDLTDAGRQPMCSSCGRYVLVYNGEIYNFMDMRREIEKQGKAPAWRGQSDTEVLLAWIAAYGVPHTLRRCNGMFALAIWDVRDRVLVLARDRLGEKPLYCGWQGETFMFASECKALAAHPAWRGDIDRNSLQYFLNRSFVPMPSSIYQGIFKLPPASMFKLTYQEYAPVHSADAFLGECETYWSPLEAALAGIHDPFDGTPEDAVDALDVLLRDAVTSRMEADVPLGAFLSGGTDSSTVVAVMQDSSSSPVKTFSMGFTDAEYNEAPHAARVAARLGTDHTEHYVTPEDARRVIPELPSIYDEPFADVSQIPTVLVSRMARKHVTVCLSGDGGDELFGGYNRYTWGSVLTRNTGRVPRVLRCAAATCLRSIWPGVWDRVFRGLNPLVPNHLRFDKPGDKIHKIIEVLGYVSSEDLYEKLVSHWPAGRPPVLGVKLSGTSRSSAMLWRDEFGDMRNMMFRDSVTYLPDDILVKVDRASMSTSLEARVPLLDHRLYEFSWRLSPQLLMRDGKSKWPLRMVLQKYLPASYFERPKTGFGVPIHDWLRGPLREWAEDLLDADRLRREGFIDPAPVRKRWREHLEGRRNWQYSLWDVLMFQAWFELAGRRAK